MLDTYLNYLEEKPKRTTRSTISRKTKIKRATGKLRTAKATKKREPGY